MKKVTVRGKLDAKLDSALSGYPKLLRSLLAGRDILTEEKAQEFLNPEYEKNHDSFLMKDMDKAVERILEAIRKDERIAIWSDYDADGVPGAVILYDFFKKIGFENFENYIPHRHDEGFGLNKNGIDELANRKTALIVTVDCGIADLKEIEHAGNLGIETIVTDHHLPQDKLPNAFAVLDPKRKDCEYPEKELCGSGVAYKLVQALCARLRSRLEIENWKLKIPVATFPIGWEKWLLDMVGLATLSDMVPLKGENRIFSYYGLKVLRKTPRPGLNAIFKKLGVSKTHLSEDDVVFSLTPKLNAASRLGSAESAFKLLSTRDASEAFGAASELIKINNERKGLVGSMVKEIRHTLAMRAFGEGPIVLGNPNWRPSLLGLAANSLAKEFGKPVFLWGRDGDNCFKGSCRSEGVTNVFELMSAAPGVFTDFGGHAFSGGFTVEKEKIHDFERILSSAYGKISRDVPDFEESVLIDSTLHIDEVLPENYKIVASLSPFGQGNHRPVFVFEDLKILVGRRFGKEKNHYEMVFGQSDGSRIRAISFFVDDNFKHLPEEGEKINLAASMENSNFAGRSELRLRVVDIL